MLSVVAVVACLAGAASPESLIQTLRSQLELVAQGKATPLTLQPLLGEVLALEDMGRRALGKNYELLNVEHVGSIVALFGEIVKLSLIKRAYDLHPFNMTCKKLSNENPVRMRCQVSEGKRQQTIQLMLNTYDGHWRIYDVQVGQKKLLHDYSRQLNALIKRWTVNGLIERLRIRHKQLLRDIRRRARSSLRQTSIQENTSKSAD